MKLSQELKSLIFKYSNTIVTESHDVIEIAKEIEAIKNDSKLEGYIFRPHFADGVEFKEYKDEDWYAIVAQWSVSFGWSDIFEFLTDENPKEILEEYFKDTEKQPFSPVYTEENHPKIARPDYLNELLKTFLESKTVLNNHQMEIISLMPVDILAENYLNTKIKIREIRTAVVSRILEEDKDFNPFGTVADIVPVIVEMYSVKESYNGGKIDRKTLKNVKVKIPRSVKNKALKTLIEGYERKSSVENFKKHQSFWKRLLRQLLLDNSFEKTLKKYPAFENVHKLVYSNIETPATTIEKLRREGRLEEAFLEEMDNPGKFLRNILFYLRYKKGDLYAVKETRKPVMQIPVKSDISQILESEKFMEILNKSNPKLLNQLRHLLSLPNFNQKTFRRSFEAKTIRYEVPLNPINPHWKETVLEKIDSAYKSIKAEENKKLGKVFVSDYFKNIKLNYSGRIDRNTVTSGQYLPIGSKIPLEFKNDSLIRYGVSWKSRTGKPLSLCIDPSITIMNGDYAGRIVNWQDPTLYEAVNSSGDITECNESFWSTELMDISVNEMKRAGSTRFFTAVINYNAPEGNLAEVDTHIFFNIVDREDRVIDGRMVEIPLEEMDYSYEINDETQAQIGLLFNLEKDEVEVLKIPLEGVRNSATAGGMDNQFRGAIENKNNNPFVYESLTDILPKGQLVSKKEDADTILDENTDLTIISNIIF